MYAGFFRGRMLWGIGILMRDEFGVMCEVGWVRVLVVSMQFCLFSMLQTS